jgi:hypothetical protein
MSTRYLLVIDEHGKAELLCDGETLWASDDDPEVLDEFGGDYFTDADGDELVEYLVDARLITAAQARDELEIESPTGPDDDEDDDEDDDDEEEDFHVRVLEDER